MGIDAEMFVRHRGRALTELEVRRLAGELAAAFGCDFFIIRPPAVLLPEGRHVLDIVSRCIQDGGPDIVPEPGEQFIRVNLFTRYYGPGYERGDWPLIAGVARWLRYRIPDCSVWYGSDHSCYEELTPELERAIWDHFCKYGHAPYNERDSPLAGTGPWCDFCVRYMTRIHSKAHGDGWMCCGCNLSVRSVGSGRFIECAGTTWDPKEGSEPRAMLPPPPKT